MSRSALQPVAPRQRAAGFGMVGKVARGFSTISGGVILGAEFGLFPAIGVGILAAAVFGWAEGLIRR